MSHTHTQEKPAKTSSQHESWNDEMARRYNPDDFITKTGAIVRWVEAQRLKRSLRLLNLNESTRTLDVGCGSGNLMERMIGKEIVGLDLSDFLLDLARKRLQNRPECKLAKGDAENLPFPDNSFDRAVCSEVLEHVQSPQKVVDEIYRVLTPGGIAVLTFPNEDMINLAKRFVLTFGLKKWIAGDYDMSDNMLEEWHVNEISPVWLKSLPKDKYRVIKSTKVPFPIFNFHQIFALEIIK